jgi:hypothetical protein
MRVRLKRMKVTSAVFLGWPREGVDVVIDGRPGTIPLMKKSLLDFGVAIVFDVEAGPAHWEKMSFFLEGDPSDGRGPLRIPGGTDDAVLVCLARRYAKAVNAADFHPGPVVIPTKKEAKAELKDEGAWTKGY